MTDFVEPESAAADEVVIGAEGPEFQWVVEGGKAREFAIACLEPEEGLSELVPITFPHVASHFWEPEGGRMGLTKPFELPRLLHGEQAYEFARPIKVGDVLTGRTRLADYYEKAGKRGGKMRFATYETTYSDAEGNLVVTCKSTLIEVAR
jgi:hypothetical protein